MLIFISDLHLAQNSRRNLKPESFRKCAQYIRETVRKTDTHIRSVDIAMLGDIFDPLLSDLWYETTIRPWSSETEVDAQGRTKRDIVTAIMHEICDDPVNRESLSHLTDLKNTLDVPFEMTYILGNHDGLVGLYPETRRMTAELLGLTNPEHYETEHLPLQRIWPEYRALGRHGHSLDPFTSPGGPSIGDAIVVDLIGKFPRVMAQDPRIDEELLEKLREIEFVRPFMDVPLWLRSQLAEHGDRKELLKPIRDCWNDVVDEFFRDRFVQETTRRRWLLRHMLQMALHVVTNVTLEGSLVRGASKMFFSVERGYDKKAAREEAIHDDLVDFVVYGHTHRQTVVPLTRINDNPKTYFNTGTWTKVYRRDGFSHDMNFQSWQMMSFVNLFNHEGHHRFEVWNALLGE
jgi:UDP-2,3-diacylglucosamine pyrophosphatase LpxH